MTVTARMEEHLMKKWTHPRDCLQIAWNIGGDWFVDHLEHEFFDVEELGRLDEHDVTHNGKAFGTAMCIVTVHDEEATLDYAHERVREYNEDNEMDLGAMKIEFADSSRTSVTAVLWRDEGASNFEGYGKDCEWLEFSPEDRT